jgi:hypothetical protein
MDNACDPCTVQAENAFPLKIIHPTSSTFGSDMNMDNGRLFERIRRASVFLQWCIERARTTLEIRQLLFDQARAAVNPTQGLATRTIETLRSLGTLQRAGNGNAVEKDLTMPTMALKTLPLARSHRDQCYNSASELLS